MIPHLPGVYIITNTTNGHQYIGSAHNLNVRKRTHWYALRHGKLAPHHKLRRAWEKYGEGAFTFTVLFVCEKEECLAKEQQAIDEIKPIYNTRKEARSNAGVTWSAETNRKKGEYAHKYEVLGVRGSVRSLALHFGVVTPSVAHFRTARGWNVEDAVLKPLMDHKSRGKKGQQELRKRPARGVQYTVDGVTGTLRELAEHFGVTNYQRARVQVLRGWPVERAVKETPREW